MARQYYGYIKVSMRVDFETDEELSESSLIEEVFPDGYMGEILGVEGMGKLEVDNVCDNCGSIVDELHEHEEEELCLRCYENAVESEE